jgi:hypothetical protein
MSYAHTLTVYDAALIRDFKALVGFLPTGYAF